MAYRWFEHVLFPPSPYSGGRLRAAVSGKSVLVTGASYGIGEALAQRLAQAGATVILVGRTLEKLEAVQAAVVADGGKAEVYAADLRDSAQVAGLLAYLKGRNQPVGIFVNNAGKSIRRSIFDSLDRLHDFERTMALNYHAPVQLLLGLIPMLVAERGHVVNVSALNVLLVPAPKWAAYQASKAAFDQWLRSVGPELEARGVSYSNVYLPLVKTRMIEPTEHYQNMAAMSVAHVVRILCRCIYGRRRWWRPWWLWAGILGSVMGRRLWEWGAARQLRRHG